MSNLKKGSDHVDITLEHDAFAHALVRRPRLGSDTSWRDIPLGTVTLLVVLSGVLMVFLGLLLGTTWTTQALAPKLRQQAKERRQLNDEWAALLTLRRQHSRCPRCGVVLTER